MGHLLKGMTNKFTRISLLKRCFEAYLLLKQMRVFTPLETRNSERQFQPETLREGGKKHHRNIYFGGM